MGWGILIDPDIGEIVLTIVVGAIMVVGCL